MTTEELQDIEESTKRTLTQVQRMKIGQRMKRLKSRMAMSRKRALKRIAVRLVQTKRKQEMARKRKGSK